MEMVRFANGVDQESRAHREPHNPLAFACSLVFECFVRTLYFSLNLSDGLKINYVPTTKGEGNKSVEFHQPCMDIELGHV